MHFPCSAQWFHSHDLAVFHSANWTAAVWNFFGIINHERVCIYGWFLLTVFSVSPDFPWLIRLLIGFEKWACCVEYGIDLILVVDRMEIVGTCISVICLSVLCVLVRVTRLRCVHAAPLRLNGGARRAAGEWRAALWWYANESKFRLKYCSEIFFHHFINQSRSAVKKMP